MFGKWGATNTQAASSLMRKQISACKGTTKCSTGGSRKSDQRWRFGEYAQNRLSVIADLSKTGEFNTFSEESKMTRTWVFFLIGVKFLRKYRARLAPNTDQKDCYSALPQHVQGLQRNGSAKTNEHFEVLSIPSHTAKRLFPRCRARTIPRAVRSLQSEWVNAMKTGYDSITLRFRGDELYRTSQTL